ncbi:hypothetical protein [Hyphomonas sp.]|uniref:hypothetical protein n=1 Tax=Hyphomonas sp. TaxID=87 RepID=UPI0025C0C703|nr:hypothetical protein [Hyphomonas sp.]
MSSRAEILKATFDLQGDGARMERTRGYQEQLRTGAEGALATDDRMALMEAFARLLGFALRGLPVVQRRTLLNYLRHRAELLSDEPRDD